MSEINCKKCQSRRYVKSGHTRGVQRYKCKECGCQFTDTKRRGIHPALKSFAIVLYAYCGVSMGKIARLYKVSTVAVLKWIRTAAVEIEPLNPVAESDIVMIDEVWHFVNGKKTRYGSGGPPAGYRVNLLEGNWAIVAMPVPKNFPIEATNSDIRYNLARFRRRSKVSSRSPQMVETSLLLFPHLQSPKTLDSLLPPLLPFFG